MLNLAPNSCQVRGCSARDRARPPSRFTPFRCRLRALEPVSRNRTPCLSIIRCTSFKSSGSLWISSITTRDVSGVRASRINAGLRDRRRTRTDRADHKPGILRAARESAWTCRSDGDQRENRTCLKALSLFVGGVLSESATSGKNQHDFC